jgi:hypothetical protein
MYAAMRRSIRAHELTGSVQVNATIMFPGGLAIALRPWPHWRSSWAG